MQGSGRRIAVTGLALLRPAVSAKKRSGTVFSGLDSLTLDGARPSKIGIHRHGSTLLKTLGAPTAVSNTLSLQRPKPLNNRGDPQRAMTASAPSSEQV